MTNETPKEQLPVWESPGIEPPQSVKENGWAPGEKPPAQYFDWLLHRTYKCLKQLQEDGASAEVQQEVEELTTALGDIATLDVGDEEVVNIVQAVNKLSAELAQHKEQIATPTNLGHVRAKTDSEGNLILPSNSVQGYLSDVTTTVAAGRTYIKTIPLGILAQSAELWVRGNTSAGRTSGWHVKVNSNLAFVVQTVGTQNGILKLPSTVDDLYVFGSNLQCTNVSIDGMNLKIEFLNANTVSSSRFDYELIWEAY